ncbi:uncharacterized protein LOC133184525 [Saccostrea echinata]|uniref:uncharacterized protein LOC133184525 n=1 Tax=Saccostrea echinata TaxID=191078 RepID=UPI002A7F9373|nr:uncharacterized protein LOC133184525 [Saccostrea echinata]
MDQRVPPEAQDILRCIHCEEKPVERYCTHCKNKFCSKCAEEHVENSSYSHHQIIKYSSMIYKMNGPQMCLDHPCKEYTMCCKLCRIPVCHECIGEKHAKHTLCSMESMFEECMKKIAVDDMKIKASLKPEIEERLSKLKSIKNDIKKGYCQLRDQAIEQKEAFKKLVDKVFEETIELVDANKKRDIEDIEKYEKEMNEQSSILDEILGFYRSKMIAHPTELIFYIKDHPEDATFSDLSEILGFTPPVFQKGFLNKDHITWQFGSFLPSVITQSVEESTEKQENQSAEPEEYVPSQEEEQQEERKVLPFPKCLFEFEFSVSDMYFVKYVHSQKFLLSGKQKDIFVVNEGGKRICAIPTSTGIGYPSGLAPTREGGIFYSDNKNKCIRKVSPDNIDNVAFRTNGRPLGICTTRSGDVIVCLQDCPGGKVVKYDERGHLKLEITHKYLIEPFCVCLNINNDICISDAISQKVIVVDRYNKERFVYEGGYSWLSTFWKFFPCDLATDSLGNILIADRENATIHIIDKDGYFLRYLLTKRDELVWPHGVCIDNKDRLWVADQVSSKIRVFEYLK